MNFAATVSSTASCMYYKTIVTIPGKRMTLAMTYLHSSINYRYFRIPDR